MPNTKDNDDQLVELLGRAELSDRQIAKRLGINSSHVSCIARGEMRPDLQPKINAAMRQTLKEAWKNGGRLATESGNVLPTKTAQVAFDRHLAVELIASGQLNLAQIAKRLGIHSTATWRIMTGRTHPELQPLIREAQRHYRDQARRLGSKWSAQIVTKQIQVGLKNNGWVGLRARQDLLDRFLGPEDDGVENEVPPAERDFGPELRDLPEPLKTEVLRALGGPDEDEETGDWLRRPEGLSLGGPEVPVTISGAATAAQEDRAAAEAAAAEDATALQKNDVAEPPSAEQEQTTPTEERCSRNKKRRIRQRLLYKRM